MAGVINPHAMMTIPMLSHQLKLQTLQQFHESKDGENRGKQHQRKRQNQKVKYVDNLKSKLREVATSESFVVYN